jgi:hypothetical protein
VERNSVEKEIAIKSKEMSKRRVEGVEINRRVR